MENNNNIAILCERRAESNKHNDTLICIWIFHSTICLITKQLSILAVHIYMYLSMQPYRMDEWCARVLQFISIIDRGCMMVYAVRVCGVWVCCRAVLTGMIDPYCLCIYIYASNGCTSLSMILRLSFTAIHKFEWDECANR